MSGKSELISQSALNEVFEHAKEGYPEEVCGLIFGARDAPPSEVKRLANRQNEFHARDPEKYPRTAATAYALGIEDISLLDRSLEGPRPCRVIYHSHVDVGAYFSAEDKLIAAPPGWGPVYPEVDYLVVDVRGDGARGARLFRFCDGDFIEIAEYSNS